MDDRTPFEQIAPTAANRPYLARIDYARDDLASLRDRLLARLPQALPGWNPALAHGGADHGVLFIDLFAHMAAILLAYADHRANESYLRTATLTRSLIDLAQLVDYRLGNGASASALQAFFAAAGKSGQLAAGFRLEAPAADAAALVFETATALEVDHTRNRMRLSGYNRSSRLLRLRADAGAVQDAGALLDAAYPGLKAGVPLVLDSGAALRALALAAVTEAEGATRLAWAPGAAGQDADCLLADLTLRGRPQETARLAAAARADEITLGQNLLPVADAAIFAIGAAILVDCAGLQLPAVVLANQPLAGQPPAGTLILSRGFSTSLRRSATRVLAGTACGVLYDNVRAGAAVLRREAFYPHTPRPGDTLLVVDAIGIEMATVAYVSGEAITLAQPIGRGLRAAAPPSGFSSPAIRYYCVAAADPATRQSGLRPVLLGELSGVYSGADTVLALDKSVDAFARDAVVALGDGATFSAHRVRRADSIDGRTSITLAGRAPASLRVALLTVYGAFEHAMHVAGYDHADGVLAAGASQLDIDGAPRGLCAGLDLLVADHAHAEGARITQVQALDGRTRIALARPLEFGYALGDAEVYGNVAAITHGAGEGDEILGGGDPAAAPQRFTLRRSPLSWIAAPMAPRGVAPALEVMVGGERWFRVETLADSGPQDRHLVVEIDDCARATVVFGDGINGAAPPSGRNNIVARYRSGVGGAANLAALAIKTMPRPAPFLQGSVNPAAASGGADAETPAQARSQVRLRVRTLERAVALADYADLALTCAGVGKARAAVEREGGGAGARRVIVVTCAAAGGNRLSTPQKEALLAYLGARSPEPGRLRIRDYRAWPLRLALTVYVLPSFQQAPVQRALLAAFGNGTGGFFHFDRRALGAAVALSDVYALAETIGGVDHVLATRFHAEGDAMRVADRIELPADGLATGGDGADAAIGRLSLQLIGGLP